MKNIHRIELKDGSKEELLPDFDPDFPYIASYVEFDQCIGKQAPWHWHKEVELFYIEHGSLEYYTPGGSMVFPAGSGGLVNSNVLHMTKSQNGMKGTVQMLHIFNTSLIGGQHGGLLEQKYVMPVITAPQLEVVGLYPDNPEEKAGLELLQESFRLSPGSLDYEMKLRTVLSDLWCRLLHLSEPVWRQKGYNNQSNEKIKLMLEYIQEHYAEKIAMSEVAAAAYISERECYRTFGQKLNMTPSAYIKDFRIQKACIMLENSDKSMTDISQSCGLGSSSYFGKVFREYMGCTPKEYQKRKGTLE